MYVPTIERLREPMVATTGVGDTEIDAVLALLDDPTFTYWSSTHVIAAGRVPATA